MEQRAVPALPEVTRKESGGLGEGGPGGGERVAAPLPPLHRAWVLGGRGRQSLPPALGRACEQRGTRR